MPGVRHVARLQACRQVVANPGFALTYVLFRLLLYGAAYASHDQCVADGRSKLFCNSSDCE